MFFIIKPAFYSSIENIESFDSTVYSKWELAVMRHSW